MGDRSAPRHVAAASLGVTIAVGAVLVWSPWSGQSLPAGVDLGDCDSTRTYTVSISASLTAVEAVPESAPSAGSKGGAPAMVPEVLLSAPFFPSPEDDVQSGSKVTVPLPVCDSFSVVAALLPAGVDIDGPEANASTGLVPSSLHVEEQRLQMGSGSVYVSDPYRLPCEDGGACAAWDGWYFTVEAAGQGDATFRTPVQWGPEGASSLDAQGQLEVHVRMDAA